MKSEQRIRAEESEARQRALENFLKRKIEIAKLKRDIRNLESQARSTLDGSGCYMFDESNAEIEAYEELLRALPAPGLFDEQGRIDFLHGEEFALVNDRTERQ